MEPVQPSSPDTSSGTQPATPDATPTTPRSGPLARVRGFFANGSPDTSSQVMVDNPPGEPAPATPGLQPRPDTTPTAVVPNPWANPDAAPSVVPIAPVAPDAALVSEPTAGFAIAGQAPGVIREPQGPTLAHDMLSNPAASFDMTASTASESAAVEPTSTPALEPTVPVVDPTATQTEPAVASAPEPVVTPAPEPTPAIAPVWTPDTSDQPSTAIEPDMRSSSSPSVEPVPSAALPEDATTTVSPETHTDQVETSEEPPLIRKVVEGDLIRYEFTPEGKGKLTAEITKAIESGALDNLANVFANEQAVELGAQATEITAPSADSMAGIESDALRTVNQGTPGNPTLPSSSLS